MNTPLLEIEGTWEEVVAHAPELAGQRVRLSVLPRQRGTVTEEAPEERNSTAESLLPFVGTWRGGDLENCLSLVHRTRTPAEPDAE